MVTRRQFLKLSASGAALLVVSKFAGVKRVWALPIPGGTLDPTTVP
jgi:hypothetical protein